ncbi:MAG: hypothetical protein ACR2HN_11970 [Tepidiformaceae bacterium]
MSALDLLMAIGFPILLVVGTIAAWRISKRENSIEVEKPTWRDTSLDDWTRERDEAAEQERLSRAANPVERTGERTGNEEQQETQTTHHRLGG